MPQKLKIGEKYYLVEKSAFWESELSSNNDAEWNGGNSGISNRMSMLQKLKIGEKYCFIEKSASRLELY